MRALIKSGDVEKITFFAGRFPRTCSMGQHLQAVWRAGASGSRVTRVV
jgi:hypothetical protein